MSLQINQPAGSTTRGETWHNCYPGLNHALYFMLYDPGLAAANDPRPQIPLEHFAPGLNRILARTDWGPEASWFNYSLSWSLIDHQHANGNHFEWYRKGEWLTKQRTGYADIAEGIASSEFSNALAIENDKPNRDASDWRVDLWQRGAQWNLVAAGDPQMVAHSSSKLYSYASGDATNLYNSSRESSTDVLHASRSIVWLKPDAVVVFDRAQTKTANRFKRWWLQSASPANVSGNNATVTTAGGQQLVITSLLPSGATLSAINTNEVHIENTVAGNEPMKVRLRIDAPGNPADVRFLQVLQAADAGVTIKAPNLIQSADAAWQGAQVGTTVVLFPAMLGRSFAGLSYAFVPPAYNHIITGLAPATAYCVTLSANSLSLAQGCSQMSDSGGVLQVSPFASSDCVFNWAERSFPQFFAPAGAPSAIFAPYYYRFYAGTNTYLATSQADDRLRVLGPATGNSLLDVGQTTSYIATAGCLP